MEEIVRGVIDIEQDGVEATAGGGRIETVGGCGEGEEVGQHEAAARVFGKDRAERNETALVPFDDGIEGLDYDQFAHCGMLQRRDRRVAEPEPAHDDIPRSRIERREAEVGESDFDFVKEARHEELLAQLDLEDFEIIHSPHAAAAQGKVPQRGCSEIEFGKISAHRPQ